MTDQPLRILNLQEAAAFLRVHRTTLGDRARGGVIPAAKVGRSWTFIESDLVAYLRNQYTEAALCRSTNNPAAASGGWTSMSQGTNGYVSQLAKLVKAKRKQSTTSARAH